MGHACYLITELTLTVAEPAVKRAQNRLPYQAGGFKKGPGYQLGVFLANIDAVIQLAHAVVVERAWQPVQYFDQLWIFFGNVLAD